MRVTTSCGKIDRAATIDTGRGGVNFVSVAETTLSSSAIDYYIKMFSHERLSLAYRYSTELCSFI